MAWLWLSWEDYCNAVHPVAIQQGSFNISQHNTRLESASKLLNSVEKLRRAISELDTLGFGRDEMPILGDPGHAEKAFRPVEDAVFAGEELLLYHRRLAKNDAAYGFLHAHELYEQWERFSGRKRLGQEVSRFLVDCSQLLEGYSRLAQVDERFLLDDAEFLPESLKEDFRLARNLFSVGFEEVGLLIAGRGLEGILRRIAKDRKLLLQIGQAKPKPADDADFADLIEVISRMRWKAKDVPLISKGTKALLHFLRTIRNGQAHPKLHGHATATPREIARTAAVAANELWRSVSESRANLDPLVVTKNW